MYWLKNNWRVDVVGAGYFPCVFSTSEQFVQSAMLLNTAWMFFCIRNDHQICHLGFTWVAESQIPHICPLLSRWWIQQLYIFIFIDFSKYISGTALYFSRSSPSPMLLQRHQSRCFIDGNAFRQTWQLNSSKLLWSSFLIIRFVYLIEYN